MDITTYSTYFIVTIIMNQVENRRISCKCQKLLTNLFAWDDHFDMNVYFRNWFAPVTCRFPCDASEP